MSKHAPIEYGDELVDDGNEIVAVYGSEFAAYLIGAVQRLAELDSWTALSDGLLVQQQVEDLIVRLIGGGDLAGHAPSSAPMKIHIENLLPYDGNMAEIGTAGVDSVHTTSMRSDTNIPAEEFAYFWIYLETGSYVVQIYYPTDSSRGYLKLDVEGGGEDAYDLFDQYSTSTVENNRGQLPIAITENGWVRMWFSKVGKAVASTGYRVKLDAVYICRSD